MLYRNLMAMDVEETIRSNPLDGVVLLGGCDKTTPACLMGAASADVPAILVTGGPKLNGPGAAGLGSCTDCRQYHEELRAGRITRGGVDEIRTRCHGRGHCMTMGTASTMASSPRRSDHLPAAQPSPPSTRAAHQLAEAAGVRSSRSSRAT